MRAFLSAFVLCLPSLSQAQAMAQLEALAGQPASAPAAFDGGGAAGEAGAAAAPPPASEAPVLPKPAPYDPASHEPAATGPKTPAEKAAWDRGKVWGGIIGGLIGLVCGSPGAYFIWAAGLPWLGVLVGAVVVAGTVAIGMDVGKHYALDDHRGNLE